MNTPIYDFVNDYISGNPVRLHMPGHKGRKVGFSGIEQAMKYDITEIDGADYLSAPCGIILESEENAGRLFGCHTFYSTEGSSLCIRAMMFLIKKYAEQNGHAPLILAGRNAHASFVNACAVLDIDVKWIMPRECDSYETCYISGNDLEKYIEECSEEPDALYVTSPDYLGNMLDIKELASVCHKHGILLLVDNAHGAYLKFLEQSLHPIDLGADMCCDSAHKTLPVLTGGAYLHISSTAKGMTSPVLNYKNANTYRNANASETCSTDCKNGSLQTLNFLITDKNFDSAGKDIAVRSFLVENARQALSIFATTSPSYLILQSLDLCNSFLDGNTGIREAAQKTKLLKKNLIEYGYCLTGNEPLKITLLLKKTSAADEKNDNSGLIDYNHLLLEHLIKSDIYVEYHDEEHIVMMFSANTTDEEFRQVEKALASFGYRGNAEGVFEGTLTHCFKPSNEEPLKNTESQRRMPPIRAMSFKEAMLSGSELVTIEESVGRILAWPILNCPPCVPLYMCGEIIGEDIKRYCKGKVAVVSE